MKLLLKILFEGITKNSTDISNNKKSDFHINI